MTDAPKPASELILYHLVNIFDEGELSREATIRKLRMVRTEGKRDVAREIARTRKGKKS